MNAPSTRLRPKAVAFDVGLALFLGLMVSGMTIGADPDHSPGALAFTLIGVIAAFLAVRRPFPELSLFGAMAALAFYLYAGLPEGPVFLLPAVATFFYAFARSLRTTAMIAAGLFLAFTLLHAFAPDTGMDLWANLMITALWLAIPVSGGTIVREARRARSRERKAEHERHRAEERVAMAREIHDVVGHSLAVVSMNAGVALHVLEKRPDAAPGVLENLRAIRDTSSRALDDLRATLRPLREGEDADLRPAFALDDVPSLIDDVRKGGLEVSCEITGDVDDLSSGVASTAYRVVQEALTNVIRHAEARSAAVLIDSASGILTIDVTDDGRGGAVDPNRPGQGITGMTERVESRGGAFHAGPATGGGFTVHAELPHSRNSS